MLLCSLDLEVKDSYSHTRSDFLECSGPLASVSETLKLNSLNESVLVSFLSAAVRTVHVLGMFIVYPHVRSVDTYLSYHGMILTCRLNLHDDILGISLKCFISI